MPILKTLEIKTHPARNLKARTVTKLLREHCACLMSRELTKGMDARTAWASVFDHSWFCWFFCEVGDQYVPREEFRAVESAFEERYRQCRKRYWTIRGHICAMNSETEEYRLCSLRLSHRWRQWYKIWSRMYADSLRSLIVWED